MTEEKKTPVDVLAEPDAILTPPEFAAEPGISGDGASGSGTLETSGKRRGAAIFIFLTVTLDMLALGMIAPVLPRLISGFLANDTVRTTEMLGIFGTLWALMQFFFSPVLGSLSDRFGRRPVVLLSNLGLGLDYLLMAWAPTLSWLFLGRIISGITSSSIPTAMAYMADVTPREKRAASFGLLSAAFGMGFVLGPAVGGLLGTVNPRLPFWVAGGLSLMNALYGLFVLPESLTLENRSQFSWKRHKTLLGMAAVLLFGYIAQQCLMNVWVIYADYRYGWTDRTVGLSLAAVGVFSGLVGGLLVKPAVKSMGERGTMVLGLIFGTAGYAAFGLSRTGLLLWCAIPFFNLMSLVWPAAQSIMTHGVGPSEQGQLQGAINSLRGIAGLLGPGLFTYIFSRSIGASAVVHAPGMPFYVAATMLLASLVVVEKVTRRDARDRVTA